MTRYKRIILDCDPGVDDAMAIIFALKCNAIILDSVTTVNGNVSVDQTTLNALKILEFMDRQDIVVAKGADRPLVVEPVHSKYVFGEDGLGNISSKLPCTKSAIKEDAVTHILDKVKQGNIDAIVAIGPLTNIANAYKKDKQLMNSIKELIIMGGAINVKGNINEFSEFNFYCDQHAADYVLKHATNLTLIPLDVTKKAIFYKSDLKQIKKPNIKELFKEITKPWFQFSKKNGQEGIALHDPLALGFAIRQDFLETQQARLKICLSCSKRGQCQVNNHTKDNKNTIVTYCHNLDSIKFKNYFIEVMNR